MKFQLDGLPEYFLWAKYSKVKTKGVDPMECGFDVQAKEVSRVLLVYIQTNEGDVLAVLWVLQGQTV